MGQVIILLLLSVDSIECWRLGE